MGKCTWWICSPCSWNIVETPQDAHHSENQVHVVHATSCHNLYWRKIVSTTRPKFFLDNQLIASYFDVELQTVLLADTHQ